MNISIKGTINHSLSRIDETNYSEFRFRERFIENALTLKIYPSIFSAVRFFKFILKNIKLIKPRHIKIIFTVLLYNKHPENE